MRILHVHSGNLFGGVETVLRCFAQAHGAEEHEFAFHFEGKIARDLRERGSRVHHLGEVRARDPFSIWRARNALAEINKRSRFDATVVHSTWTLGLMGQAAARPLVYYQHDVLSGSHWTERFARRAAPDLIIANSAYTARSTPLAFHGQGAVVVHPPADLPTRVLFAAERSGLRERWGASDSDVVILIAARFEPWKGHRLLLEAVAQIQANPRWVLWIAGEPQRAHEVRVHRGLQQYAEQAGIASRLRFLGHADDMPSVMQAADIYCQPNTEPEPFGLTFIEALHAGLPVVTTRLGGAEEILVPEPGALVDARPAAVATALEDLISTPQHRLYVGHNGQPRALQLCDTQRQVARFVQSIETLRKAQAA